MDAKQAAATKACELVESGNVVGLGTGSTAELAIRRLGERVGEGLEIRGIPTSEASLQLARHLDIPLTTLEEDPVVDVAIDGADEVDPKLDLVKGLGGALLREKIVAAAAKRFVVIVDESKVVDRLGQKAPVPVEVLQFGWVQASWRLKALGCEPVLRRKEATPFLSDNGNYILDCRFERIDDAARLGQAINDVPGVVEHGLFLGMADAVIVGRKDGTTETRRRT